MLFRSGRTFAFTATLFERSVSEVRLLLLSTGYRTQRQRSEAVFVVFVVFVTAVHTFVLLLYITIIK